MGREWGENPSGKFPTTLKKKKKTFIYFSLPIPSIIKGIYSYTNPQDKHLEKKESLLLFRLFCDGMFDSNRQLDFVSIVRNMPNRENRFENSYFSLSFSVLLTNVEKKKIKSEKNQS